MRRGAEHVTAPPRPARRTAAGSGVRARAAMTPAVLAAGAASAIEPPGSRTLGAVAGSPSGVIVGRGPFSSTERNASISRWRANRASPLSTPTSPSRSSRSHRGPRSLPSIRCADRHPPRSSKLRLPNFASCSRQRRPRLRRVTGLRIGVVRPVDDDRRSALLAADLRDLPSNLLICNRVLRLAGLTRYLHELRLPFQADGLMLSTVTALREVYSCSASIHQHERGAIFPADSSRCGTGLSASPRGMACRTVRGECVREQNSLPCYAVERRCLDDFVTVSAGVWPCPVVRQAKQNVRSVRK